jgi:hypothetical protein
MKNAKRKKPKRTMPYIRAVLDRLTRRRWPDWKQEFAYEQLLWERFLWRCVAETDRRERGNVQVVPELPRGS